AIVARRLSDEQRPYEMVLMLDTAAEEAGRDAIVQAVRSKIEAAGALTHASRWGVRKMAYGIEKKNEADYRWLRFDAPRELLADLDHSLKIADGVLRFRVFKVDPDSAVITSPPPVGAPIPAREDDDED